MIGLEKTLINLATFSERRVATPSTGESKKRKAKKKVKSRLRECEKSSTSSGETSRMHMSATETTGLSHNSILKYYQL